MLQRPVCQQVAARLARKALWQIASQQRIYQDRAIVTSAAIASGPSTQLILLVIPQSFYMQVAARLAEKGWLPDLIVSSNSTRTKQTLDTMAEAHPAFSEADTLFRGSLYTVAALDGQTRKHLQVSLPS